MKEIKKYWILGVLLVMTQNIQAQTVGKWRSGSALELSGNVYTLSCFVSGTDEEWTKSEKESMLKKLKESQNWIIKEAVRYNVTVNFNEGGSFGLDKDIKLPYIERGTASGNESVDWVSKVLYAVGYTSTLKLIDWVEKNTKCTNTQVIIFAKGKGNGYAMASSTGMDKEKFFVEGAILYELYNSGRKLASFSIAHEMLHLYGAWDLYKTFSQTAENEKKSSRTFSKLHHASNFL